METSLNCFLAVGKQDSDQKTYAEIDGTLLVNQEGEFFGKTINCELNVVRDIVDACLGIPIEAGDVGGPPIGHPIGKIEQNIRATVTIDGEDVTDSLVGGITINHNKNYISTFSFQLGNRKYSPLKDSHIAVDSEVIIIVFINGEEMRLFTGLIDTTDTDFDGGYKLSIRGRGYGKKLLEKTMTLISIEQSASRKYRGALVELIAGQGSITNIDVPKGDKIGIDHSFQDQSLWDMIQKECAIEGWYVRFDENGKMILKATNKKSTADWEYGEDKFEELGLETSDRGIINKVTILGAIWEEVVITVEVGEEVVQVEVPTEEHQETVTTFSKSFSAGEVVTLWTDGDSDLNVRAEYIGHTTPMGYIFPTSQNYKFIIKGSKSGKISSLTWSVSGGASKGSKGSNWVTALRKIDINPFVSAIEKAFSITITVKIKELVAGGSIWIDETIPTETTTTTIIRHQVKATVTDTNSIALYGERKPNNEGTLQFPLAETKAQCKRIGEYVIIESHRFTKQPDYLVAFNPKLVVGCTVKLVSPAIGYNEEWVVEEVIHKLNIDDKGAIKARTRIGCVYYA